MAKADQKSDSAPQAEPCRPWHLISAGEIAARIDRPTPWVEAKIGELGLVPALQLDRAVYYEFNALELVTAANEELKELARKAKQEMQAAGM